MDNGSISLLIEPEIIRCGKRQPKEANQPWQRQALHDESCVAVDDGLDAVVLLEDKSQAFDLAITDFRMPRGSGWRVVQAANEMMQAFTAIEEESAQKPCGRPEQREQNQLSDCAHGWLTLPARKEPSGPPFANFT